MGILSILDGISDLTSFVIVSRALVASAWFVALRQIWKCRTAPMANQAYVASVAIILGEFLMIFHEHIPTDTLIVFVSVAQFIMAMVVMKMFKWTHHLTTTEINRIDAMEAYRVSQSGQMLSRVRLISRVAAIGMVYFLLIWLEQGH